MNAFDFPSFLTKIKEFDLSMDGRNDFVVPTATNSRPVSTVSPMSDRNSASSQRRYLESQLFQDSYTPEKFSPQQDLNADPENWCDALPVHQNCSQNFQNGVSQEPMTYRNQYLAHSVSEHDVLAVNLIRHPMHHPFSASESFPNRVSPPPAHLQNSSNTARIPPAFSQGCNNIQNHYQQMPQKLETRSEDNAEVFEVTFKRSTKDFLLGVRVPSKISVDDMVIVTGERGEDLGIVSRIFSMEEYLLEKFQTTYVPGVNINASLGRILRLATPREKRMLSMKLTDEQDVLQYAIHLASDVHFLNILLLDAEYQFDRHKITLYYDTNSRINFRNFVNDIHGTFKAFVRMEKVDADTWGHRNVNAGDSSSSGSVSFPSSFSSSSSSSGSSPMSGSGHHSGGSIVGDMRSGGHSFAPAYSHRPQMPFYQQNQPAQISAMMRAGF